MSANKEFSPQSPISTKVRILEQIDHGTYKASLRNGKIIHIHSPKSPPSNYSYQNGDLVIVELKPYDFSRGRIIMQTMSQPDQVS
jgi:translation initiation factor IF-1